MYRLATAQNFSAVTGACLMVKKNLYDALDGLDETNFAVAPHPTMWTSACACARTGGYVNG